MKLIEQNEKSEKNAHKNHVMNCIKSNFHQCKFDFSIKSPSEDKNEKGDFIVVDDGICKGTSVDCALFFPVKVNLFNRRGESEFANKEAYEFYKNQSESLYKNIKIECDKEWSIKRPMHLCVSYGNTKRDDYRTLVCDDFSDGNHNHQRGCGHCLAFDLGFFLKSFNFLMFAKTQREVSFIFHLK